MKSASMEIYNDGDNFLRVPPETSTCAVSCMRAAMFLSVGLCKTLKHCLFWVLAETIACMPIAAAYFYGGLSAGSMNRFIKLSFHAFFCAAYAGAATILAHHIFHAVRSLYTGRAASDFPVSDSESVIAKQNAPDRVRVSRLLLAAAGLAGIAAACSPPMRFFQRPLPAPREYQEELEPSSLPFRHGVAPQTEISTLARTALKNSRVVGRV